MKHQKELTNRGLFNESKQVLVGGVNSPVRAMKPDYPFFVTESKGCFLHDVEKNKYIDYCMGYGPLLFGHTKEEILKELYGQMEKGLLYGTPTELELEFARELVSAVPNVEMIRSLNTGTGATMTAIRLARGISGNNDIIKFTGGYHGAHDAVLVKAGSGALTHAVPDSHGIPKRVAEHTLLSRYNDLEYITALFEKNNDIAAVLIEPVMGNIGCVLPEENFLQEIRKLCTENNALLIFDEVITGFRLALGGAQEYFGIDADIVTLGKIIGGGLPIGILGAKREIMENLAPMGKIYNAGTFNGNPMTTAAGLATIRLLRDTNPYPGLEKTGNELRSGLQDIFPDTSVQGIASMLCMYFSETKVKNYEEAISKADKDMFLQYQRFMLKNGVFHPPSQFECNFVSTAHTDDEIAQTLEIAKQWKK